MEGLALMDETRRRRRIDLHAAHRIDGLPARACFAMAAGGFHRMISVATPRPV
jgi:hypothetical protein